MSKRFCSHCGTPIPDNCRFCVKCGTPADDEFEGGRYGEQYEDDRYDDRYGGRYDDSYDDDFDRYDDDRKGGKKKGKGLIIVLVALIVVLLAAAAVLFILKPFDSDDDKDQSSDHKHSYASEDEDEEEEDEEDEEETEKEKEKDRKEEDRDEAEEAVPEEDAFKFVLAEYYDFPDIHVTFAVKTEAAYEYDSVKIEEAVAGGNFKTVDNVQVEQGNTEVDSIEITYRSASEDPDLRREVRLTVGSFDPVTCELPAIDDDLAEEIKGKQEAAAAPAEEKKTSRYEVIGADVSWSEAKSRCESAGGHLATITSEEEFNQIVGLASQSGYSHFWIGGYTSVSGDGSITAYWITGEDFNYSRWSQGEPSGKDTDGTPESCLMLWNIERLGGWGFNDQRDNPIDAGNLYGKMAYVCEWEE